jgi:AmmeMemoRadiSam system protein B
MRVRDPSRPEMLNVRPSPIAGTWYPGSPEALARSVDAQLNAAPADPIPGEVVAVIAPHAGHRYSGEVAATAFRTLKGTHRSPVAVVSPMHHPYPGQVLTSGHSAYVTPLGEVPIDQDCLGRLEAALLSSSRIRVERVTNDSEHSLEIELPFLQRSLSSGFQLVPVMLRDQDRPVSEAVGHALAAALTGSKALLVASSDLSHFYPGPVARSLDHELLARIQAFDPVAVLNADEEGVGFACGRGAIAAVLWAAGDLGADQVRLLGYANSGDVTGDQDSVVGYGAAVIFRAFHA